MGDASRVENLQPGDHACLTFSDDEERIDIVAAFVRDGLRLGQKVLCLTEAVPEATLAGELGQRGLPVDVAAEVGQLTVMGSGDVFISGGSFSMIHMIGTMRDEIEKARREGYHGLRITSDMCWALRPVSGISQLMDYETALSKLLAEQKATAVCQYDRQCFDTVTLAGVVAHHGLTVAAVTYHDDALLRICRQHVPPGIRVAGEIDYRAAGPFKQALTEALGLDDHIDVNLSQLRFIDAAIAGTLLQAAISIAPPRVMTVRCRPLVHKVLEILGANDIASLRMVAVGDGS